MICRKVKLKEICTFQEGYVNPKQTIHNYFDGEVKWLRASDINDTYIYETGRTLTKKGYESAGKSAKLFKPNTIAISKSGTIGRVGIIKDYMCGNRAVINIIPDIDKVDLMYLFYILKSKRRELEEMAQGTVQKNLYIFVLEELIIDLPSLETQTKISRILSNLDNKIKNNKDINNNLYELSNNLLKRWFVEYECALYKRLDEVSDCQNGHAFYKEGYDNKGLMVIDLGNVDLNSNFVYTNADKFIEKDRIPSDKFVVKKNDLIMIMTDRKATMDLLGKTAKVFDEREYALNQRIYRIRSKINVNYLYTYLNSDKVLNELKNKALGSVQKYINTNVINEIQIPLFEESIMEKFSNIVDPIFKYMENNVVENRNLEKLRDTLLPKLMNGEIDLNNIEV